jgi:hypothetical protein
MKKAVVVVVALLSSALAQACIGEAQIIANVARVESVNSEIDLVTVGAVTLYNENITCPLDLQSVVGTGIQVRSGIFHAGSSISGVVVQHEDSSLHLE